VTATATADSTPSASASFLAISLLANGQFTETAATNTSSSKAWVGTNASVDTGTGDLTFTAIAHAIALSHGSGVGAGAFSAGTTQSTATLQPQVGAFTVGSGAITGRNATFLTRLNSNEAGTAADLQALFEAMGGPAGREPGDATGSGELPRGLRVGVPGGFFADLVHEETLGAVEELAEVLADHGARVEGVDGGGLEGVRRGWMGICGPEVVEAQVRSALASAPPPKARLDPNLWNGRKAGGS